MTRYIHLIITLLMAAMLAGCEDDLRIRNLGEGNATVSATVKFHPLITAPVGDPDSRTPGNEIRTIRNIQVVVYKPNNETGGKLYGVYRYGEGYATKFTSGTQTDMPDDHKNDDQAEASTMTASFTINDLPYGRYKMYVVANYRELNEADIQTPVELMNHKAVWDPDDVSNNDQMFGCFATDNQSDYDDAPVLEISKETETITAWIKRLASKLTIVYDGQELHEGINIYIKNVTVRDIPKECVLGFNKDQLTEAQKQDQKNINGNAPSSREQLWETTPCSSLYYKKIYEAKNSEEVDEVETYATDPGLTDYQQWMQINKSTVAIGAVETKDHKLVYKPTPEGSKPELMAHTETMQALFFYENCQGNYPGEEEYNKTPKPGDVGKDETEDGIYKDKIPYGTFIEVEGYYVSTNPDNQSSGSIKYRFMLGQNETFNYNALRNRHYKILLKFKGYANQPEWHIVYEEEEPGLYPLPEYNVSYQYNIRHEMPIRLTGEPYKVTLQIIENNWAPYDPSQTDSVPPPTVGTGNQAFRWYRDLYKQISNPPPTSATTYEKLQDYSVKPTNSYDGLDGYYYGLQTPSKYRSLTPYTPAVNYMAGEQVTPIWVGFLALQVPQDYENYTTILPTGIQNEPTDHYEYQSTIQGIRNYYTGNGGRDSDGKSNTSVKLYQCTYDFGTLLPNANAEVQVPSDQGARNAAGRNAAKLKNNGDGSYTIYVPFFTMPKAMGEISGFSGNNPYEAYKRRAKVLITAYYKQGDKDVKIVKRVPVFQQQRIVNPKGVWRTGDRTESFRVRLSTIDSSDPTRFYQFDSEGEWSAWVATPMDEQTPNRSSFIELEGVEEDGKIHGITGSKVDFSIKFKGTTESSRCAKVIIKYHGNVCEHAIFVRQGYNVPLAISNGGKRWSSFSVYAFQGADMTTAQAVPNSTSALPSATQNLNAEMTINPLALGTMYKRGNYGRGIRIINNKTWGVLDPILNAAGDSAQLQTIRLNPDNGNRQFRNYYWSQIYGIRAANATQRSFNWTTFHSGSYNYDLPTYDDFVALSREDFGIGVLYADGATTTAMTTDEAFGYFNDGNDADMITSEYGMRGIIVYNKTNFNQIFFPVGYSGVGVRTQFGLPSNTYKGYLRYGSTYYRLSSAVLLQNQYRPIPYNMPASPGSIYWLKTTRRIQTGTNASGSAVYANYTAWDINYFDLAFNPYTLGSIGDPYGDAAPAKPIIR